MVSSNAKNIKLTRYDDLFESTIPPKETVSDNKTSLPLSELHPFRNHPFKQYNPEKMLEMVESVRQNGILMPILVRPEKDAKGYEIISGHNRVEAAKQAGLSEIPANIREMDDETAIILMVDSNLRQREKLLPSEKAFAYKMKLDALKRQGERTDLTSRQVGKKLLSVEQVGDNVDESARNIHRFIRLTELVPPILDMVDEGKIAFNPAVAISYLNNEQQDWLREIIDRDDCTPSLSQAERLKDLAQKEKLDFSAMDTVLTEPKPQQNQLMFKRDRFEKYFPREYTTQQIEDTLLKLLESWYKKRQQEKSETR